jgi:uncharacterized protein (TIGR03435 family)
MSILTCRSAAALCVMLAPVVANAQGTVSRPTFEVASVRASDPNARMINGLSIEDHFQMIVPFAGLPLNGRQVTAKNRSLRSLIAMAYEVRPSQVVGPAWLADLRFDVNAKIAEDAATADALVMFQSLLEERFGLKMHREQQMQSGYALLVGKNGPKLKEAAPRRTSPEDQERMKARLAEENAKRMTRPPMPFGRTSSYSHITMARLAAVLTPLAQREVIDKIGLLGMYEVALDMTPSSRDEDPVVGVLRAVEELGLKLQSQKVPVDVVVIDAISKVPTEN